MPRFSSPTVSGQSSYDSAEEMQSLAAGTAASKHQTFPLRVLMGRLSTMSSSPWAPYLPDNLRPRDVAAKSFDAIEGERNVSKATSGSSEDTMPAYKAEGIPVIGRVWEFSQTAQGSREVQHAIECHTSSDELLSIAGELKGHAWDAMRCPHANHVMQKLVVESQPENLQFIIDSIVDANLCVQAARHKFACRVVQRLVQYCSQEQVSNMVGSIAESAAYVACHAFGNYVIQELLQHPNVTRTQKLQICRDVRERLSSVCSDPHGVAVLSTVMSAGPAEEGALLAEAMLAAPKLFVHLACSRHGHAAAREVLVILQGEDRRRAQEILSAEESVLSSSRYGRLILSHMNGGVEDLNTPGPVLLGRTETADELASRSGKQ
mmetsp:Transcript_57812/g.102671  ORF Transcript_57812/g.102671 Transcript_57812/m.102671 type:complete len:378 (+) Transcript_57812:59-1192(+)